MKLDLVSADTANSSYGYFLPNQQRTILFPGLKPYKVTINALGFRTVGANLTEKDLKTKRIIFCIGDSLTFGLFADDEAAYPYKLQSLYDKANKPVAVLNAGIGGTSIGDQLYYLKEKGLALNPQVVLINFCSNDLREMKEKASPYYARLMAERNQGGFARVFKQTPLARAFRRAYVISKYRRWMRKIDDLKIRQILETESKSLDDVLYVCKTYFAEDVLKNPDDPQLLDDWKQYFLLLDETIMLLKSKKIRMIYIITPEVLTVYDQTDKSYQKKLKSFLQSRDVEYIDLSDEAKKYSGDKLELFNSPPRDYHLSDKGAALLADRVYHILEN